MSLREILFGRALRSEEQEAQKIGPAKGVPVLGLDALASAAYGPEAALTILIALGAGAARYIEPISALIILVLVVLYVSYRQTIKAYQNGGGAYTVASENLGRTSALVAAGALCLDYILNVAVAISAGVGAIVSAAPVLLPYTLVLCLAILAALTVTNLRGVRESGLLFMLPTYVFLAFLGGTVVLGIVKVVLTHGHPIPVVTPPAPHFSSATVTGLGGAWLLVRAFASGCTAMTGVEAVSNGVPLFKEPVVRNARRTLSIIIGALVFLLAGIAYLSRTYGIVATPPAWPGIGASCHSSSAPSLEQAPSTMSRSDRYSRCCVCPRTRALPASRDYVVRWLSMNIFPRSSRTRGVDSYTVSGSSRSPFCPGFC
jgi:amino acid transporter